MSRRCHHGSPRHVRNGRERPRPVIPERPIRGDRLISGEPLAGIEASAPQPSLEPAPAAIDRDEGVLAEPTAALDPVAPEAKEPEAKEAEAIEPQAIEPQTFEAETVEPAAVATEKLAQRIPRDRPIARNARSAPRVETMRPNGTEVHAAPDGDEAAIDRGATAPQLRRFIKSRAYVPMHELRRRFAINGGDDDVTQVELDRRRVYVGLPEREGRLLGDLLRGGDIGYELSLDPISPIVVGVYPMRPVTRA
jgi:hypothetical protein